MWASEKNVSDYTTVVPTNLTQLWILSRLANCVYKINNSFKNYNTYIYVAEFKQFFMNEFCNIFLVNIFLIYFTFHLNIILVSNFIVLGNM